MTSKNLENVLATVCIEFGLFSFLVIIWIMAIPVIMNLQSWIPMIPVVGLMLMSLFIGGLLLLSMCLIVIMLGIAESEVIGRV